MVMRFTGQGVGHKATWMQTANFREDLQAAFGNISQDQSDEDPSEDSDSESDSEDSSSEDSSESDVGSESEDNYEDYASESEDDYYEDYAELVENGDVYGEEQLLGMEAF